MYPKCKNFEAIMKNKKKPVTVVGYRTNRNNGGEAITQLVIRSGVRGNKSFPINQFVEDESILSLKHL